MLKNAVLTLSLGGLLMGGLAAQGAAEDAKPSVLFIGKPQIYTQVTYQDELERHGFQVDSASWPEVTPHNLRRYNAIVITHFVDEGSNVESGGVTGDAGFGLTRQRFVDDYMKAGGGVLVFLNTIGCYGKGKLGTVPAWFKKYDLDFYAESVSDPEREVLASSPSLRRYSQKFAWTESFVKHPITDGVTRLWYPTGWGGHVAGNAVPITCGHQWDKLVLTGPAAKHVSPGEDVWADLYRKNPPPGPHALLAVRKANLGRLAVIGVSPLWTVWSPYDPGMGDAVMKSGEQGKPSDFWKLLENCYRWLADPSRQMGIYGSEVAKRPPVPGDTPAIPWSELTFPPPPAKFFRGTCGAHTAYSTGKGTVAEWAAAAKQAGFNFVIFAEDLAAMDGEKWHKLQADCKGATTTDFVAWPGIEYRNAAGVRGFMPLGYSDWFPADWLTDDGRRVNIDRGWTPAKGWGAKTGHKSGQIMAFLTWWHNGYFDFSHNSSPFWDYKLYCFFPVWSAERRQPLDSAVDKYLEVCAAHVNPAAYALDLTFEPADLADAIATGRPHLAVSADPDPRCPEEPTLQNVFNRMVVNAVKDGMGSGNYRGWSGPVATQGPALRWMFRGGYQWEGVELPRYWIERHAGPQEKDWYMPSWYRLKLRLDAQSEAGVRAVTVYDGDRGPFRRFDAKDAKQFSAEFDVTQCPTRHLIAVVTDRNGRQAVSREIWMEQQTMLYNYCGDRVNVPGSIFSPIHGHPFAPPDPKKPLREIRRFFADLVSPDILIERYRSDAVYKQDELSDEMGWHNWAPHYPRDDYTITQRGYAWYQGHSRTVSYNTHPSQGVYWDGFVPVETVAIGKLPLAKIEIMESEMAFLKPGDLDPDGFIARSVTSWEQPVTAEAPGAYAFVPPDGTIESGQLADLKAPLVRAIPSGTVILSGPKEGAAGGQSALWTGDSLACRIAVTAGKAAFKAGVKPAAAPAGGQKFAWRTETVNRQADPRQVANPTWFKVRQGEATDRPLCELRTAARDGAVVIEVKKAALDTNCQPLVVAGIEAGWTAVYYEKGHGLVRPIGVWNGKAFAQLPATKADTTVVIGNLVVADQPGVRADAVQETDDAGAATGRWLVDAHNPGTTNLDVRFSVPAAFDLLKTHTHTVQIPAGASVRFALE